MDAAYIYIYSQNMSVLLLHYGTLQCIAVPTAGVSAADVVQ